MYYKILKSNMKHHNMQYHEGLNTNCEKTFYDGECNNGLFFSDKNHIMEFCSYGELIADVTLPEGEPVSQCNGKCKAHRIILSNIRPLWTVETLKALKDEVDLKNHQYTILDVVIKQNQLGVLKYLFNQKICTDYRVAMSNAAVYGQLDILKYLLEKKENQNPYFLNTSLLRACHSGQLETVKYLIQQGADIHYSNDIAFVMAIQAGPLDVVKYLIDCGINIHENKEEALQKATECGQIKMIKYLLEQGADPTVDLYDYENQNPFKSMDIFETAILFDRLEAVKIFIKYKEFTDRIVTYAYLAIKHNNFDIVKFFVKKGLDINTVYDYAFEKAATENNLKDMDYFMKLGADIHKNDEMLFRTAVRNDILDVVQFYVQQGVNIHANQDEVFNIIFSRPESETGEFLVKQYSKEVDAYIESKC